MRTLTSNLCRLIRIDVTSALSSSSVYIFIRLTIIGSILALSSAVLCGTEEHIQRQLLATIPFAAIFDGAHPIIKLTVPPHAALDLTLEILDYPATANEAVDVFSSCSCLVPIDYAITAQSGRSDSLIMRARIFAPPANQQTSSRVSVISSSKEPISFSVGLESVPSFTVDVNKLSSSATSESSDFYFCEALDGSIINEPRIELSIHPRLSNYAYLSEVFFDELLRLKFSTNNAFIDKEFVSGCLAKLLKPLKTRLSEVVGPVTVQLQGTIRSVIDHSIVASFPIIMQVKVRSKVIPYPRRSTVLISRLIEADSVTYRVNDFSRAIEPNEAALVFWPLISMLSNVSNDELRAAPTFTLIPLDDGVSDMPTYSLSDATSTCQLDSSNQAIEAILRKSEVFTALIPYKHANSAEIFTALTFKFTP